MAVTTFDITQETILVRLHMEQGSLSASSKTLQEEAAEKHSADKKSMKTGVLILLPEDLKEAGITNVRSRAGVLYYRNTLPWDDRAYRLLPLRRFDALKEQMDALAQEHAEAVERLIERYDELKASYVRRVNDLADEIPFPSKQELRAGFGFGMTSLPLVNTSDLRLKHVSAATVEQIKHSVNEQLQTRLFDAQFDIVDRLVKKVEVVVTVTGKDKTVIHDSLIENIGDACSLLPTLNISDDPTIAALIELVQDRLANVDVQQLRDDKKYRAQICQTAKVVLGELQNWTARALGE